MDWDKKVSVVMPVYNTGKYFKECVDSVIAQTYPFWELICVDDCSTDLETRDLLKHYEQADERISVIWLDKNVGAAEARNIGLTYATGKYILFLDSDDTFDKYFFETMVSCADKTNADVCVCAHRICYEDGKIEEVQPRKKEGVTDRVFSLAELGEQGLTYWWGVPWNKIYRREHIVNNGLYFQTLKSSNDEYFANVSVLLAGRIAYVDNSKPLIFYRMGRKGQISSKRDPRNSYLFVEKIIDDYWDNADDVRKTQILFQLVFGCIYWIKSAVKEHDAKALYEKVHQKVVAIGGDVPGEKLSLKMRRCITLFLKCDYEDDWISLLDDYDKQLSKVQTELIEHVSSYKNIVIWGNGKRGVALQKLLSNNKVTGVSVVEAKALKPYINQFGNHVDHEFIRTSNQIIIASNSEIYNEIRQKTGIKGRVINLEEFCPL